MAKLILLVVVAVIGLNLFLYARLKRRMAQINADAAKRGDHARVIDGAARAVDDERAPDEGL